MGFLIQAVKGPKIFPFYLSVLCISAAGMFREEALLCVIVPLAVYVFLSGKKSGLAKKAATVVIMAVLAAAPAPHRTQPSCDPAATSRCMDCSPNMFGTIVHSLRRMSRRKSKGKGRPSTRVWEGCSFRSSLKGTTAARGDYIIYNRDYPRVMRGIPREKNFFVLKKVVQTALRQPLQLSQTPGLLFSGILSNSPSSAINPGCLEGGPAD